MKDRMIIPRIPMYSTLHKKRKFSLRISSVNVSKSLMENFIFCEVTSFKEAEGSVKLCWFLLGTVSDGLDNCKYLVLPASA